MSNTLNDDFVQNIYSTTTESNKCARKSPSSNYKVSFSLLSLFLINVFLL